MGILGGAWGIPSGHSGILKMVKINSWEDLGEYFNYDGGITVKKNPQKGNLISLSFAGSDKELFESIKSFLKYGHVRKRYDNDTFIFSTLDRKHILDFLLNVYPYAPLRQPVIDFLIKGYGWTGATLNTDFNFPELERLNKIWKLKSKEQILLKEKSRIESKKLEGGEDDIHI